MKLTWNGHSCFTFDTDMGIVVFDPYETDYVPGLHLPELAADVILCSHEHNDHCYPEGVRNSRRGVGFTVELVDTFHDGEGGSLRGENKVHIIDADGFRLAHLGDLGHVPTEAQFAAMGRVDALLVPIGGFYTIDAVQAKEICDRLQSRMIFPMHYRKGDMGFDLIAEPNGFLDMFDHMTWIDGHTAELTEDLRGVVMFTQPHQ